MRLAGEIKLGYYPTPPEIMAPLATGFIPPHSGDMWTAFDPFCGTGAALAMLQAPFSAGSDLDRGRLADAATRLSLTQYADAFALKRRTASTSVLLLNPPYMLDLASHQRQEIRALHTFTPWVVAQGWIVLIIPRALLFTYRAALDDALILHALWRFPDPAYAAFGQVIIIGRPQRGKTRVINDWEAWLTHDRPPDVGSGDQAWVPRYQPEWPRPLPMVVPPRWRIPSADPFVSRLTLFGQESPELAVRTIDIHWTR